MRVDDFIGHRFGVDKHLEVIGWTGKRRGSAKLYYLKCNVCSQDPELFGDGVFTAAKADLLKGNIVCGCSKSFRRNEWQYNVEVSRICSVRGYKFLGFASRPVGAFTYLDLSCELCGNVWGTTNISSLKLGRGCPSCGVSKSSKNQMHAHEDMVKDFMKPGKLPDGCTFKRCDDDSKFWDVLCPVCSKDEFVQHGLCTGVFRTHVSSLKAGSVPCRCSAPFHYTQPQWEFKVKLRLSLYSHLTFDGWRGEFKGARSAFGVRCSEHGVFERGINEFVHNGTENCPSCSDYGYNRFKVGVLYVLGVVSSDSKKFTGFGISNNVDRRLSEHRRELAKFGYEVEKMCVIETLGQIALDVENEIKYNFKLHSQDIDGFRREATCYTLYQDVIWFAENRINLKERNATTNTNSEREHILVR